MMTSVARPRERPPLAFAAVAAVLCLVLASCAAATPSPTPSPVTPGPTTSATRPSSSASMTASAAPSTDSPGTEPSSTGMGTCAPSDLTASGGRWDGAAGSRGSDVTVTGAGATACGLPATPVVEVADATGNVLVRSQAPLGSDGPSLAAGGTSTFSVLISNWCDRSTILPLHVLLELADGSVEIGGLTMSSADLPPCDGPGQPAQVSTTPWRSS